MSCRDIDKFLADFWVFSEKVTNMNVNFCNQSLLDTVCISYVHECIEMCLCFHLLHGTTCTCMPMFIKLLWVPCLAYGGGGGFIEGFPSILKRVLCLVQHIEGFHIQHIEGFLVQNY